MTSLLSAKCASIFFQRIACPTIDEELVGCLQFSCFLLARKMDTMINMLKSNWWMRTLSPKIQSELVTKKSIYTVRSGGPYPVVSHVMDLFLACLLLLTLSTSHIKLYLFYIKYKLEKC